MIHKFNYKTKAEDVDEKGRVKIVINAIGNVDAQKDRSMPGSFNKTLKENMGNIYHYLNHNADQLIGVPIEGYEQDKQVVMVSQLNLEKAIARDTYSDYKLFAKHNRTLKHSVGVSPVNGKTQMKGDVREVHEWKLFEFSTLTKWPANDNTPLIDIKSRPQENIQHIVKSLSEMQEWFELVIKEGEHNQEYIDKLHERITTFEKAIRNHISEEPHVKHSEAKELIENFNIENLI